MNGLFDKGYRAKQSYFGLGCGADRNQGVGKGGLLGGQRGEMEGFSCGMIEIGQGKVEEWCIVIAPSKKALLEWFDRHHIYLRPSLSDDFMAVYTPCGSTVIYKNRDDIPDHSVPCPCGNPKHWIIKYEEDGYEILRPVSANL